MTDFVRRIMRPEAQDWAVRSLLDVDFYKPTMCNWVRRNFRGTTVTFGFTNRHPHVPLADIVGEGELRAQLDHARTLRFEPSDVYYLRGMDVYGEQMFPQEFLAFLPTVTLPPYRLWREGDQYRFETAGPWEHVMWWETIFLATLCELIVRTVLRETAKRYRGGETDVQIFFARAIDRMYQKFQLLKLHPEIRIALFGLRRRAMFLWERFITQMAKDMLGAQIAGTSTVYLAREANLLPIGTIAHEIMMVLIALARPSGAEAMIAAQYEAVKLWAETYPQRALRILLTDAYGSEQFYRNMPDEFARWVAREFRGERYDSGSMRTAAERHIRWLKKFGADPRECLGIPSDGLNIDVSLFALFDAIGDRLPMSPGIGTMITHDFDGCHPRGAEPLVIGGKELPITIHEALKGHSFVCKAISANGNACTKLSNNVNKASGPKDVLEHDLRVFGTEGRVTQPIIV